MIAMAPYQDEGLGVHGANLPSHKDLDPMTVDLLTPHLMEGGGALTIDESIGGDRFDIDGLVDAERALLPPVSLDVERSSGSRLDNSGASVGSREIVVSDLDLLTPYEGEGQAVTAPSQEVMVDSLEQFSFL